MSKEFTKKADKLRIDKERNLIFIPGQDSPKELIAPIQERVDRDGVPYQHVVTPYELLEVEHQHERCMKFMRDAMKVNWKCDQCGKTWPGTKVKLSAEMFGLLRELMQPGGHKVDWDSIVEHLGEHMFCPGVVPEGNCKGRCVPVREVPS